MSCHPTPLLPCGSPVPLRGGSESMAHSYCESQIPDRVKDDPGRKLFPRRNAIVTCMTKWRKSNQVGLALTRKNSSVARKGRIVEPETPGVSPTATPGARKSAGDPGDHEQANRATTGDSPPITEQKNQSLQDNPDVAGIAEAGSYSCDWSKGGAINCRPIPVLSCGTSRLSSIDSEEKALENCENFVPQSIQDDPGRKLFPRKTAMSSCMNRWRMSNERRQKPGK
jgi:hypothetical protein